MTYTEEGNEEDAVVDEFVWEEGRVNAHLLNENIKDVCAKHDDTARHKGEMRNMLCEVMSMDFLPYAYPDKTADKSCP